MAIMAGLALAGAAVQTIGALAALQAKKQEARLRERELKFQAQAEQDLFDFTFPFIQRQQAAQRGLQASQFAKKGVAFEGSVLAFLGEQAAQHSRSNSLAIHQQLLNQRALRFDQKLARRAGRQASREQIFTVLAGITGGATDFAEKGGFAKTTTTSFDPFVHSQFSQPAGPPRAS